MSYSQTFLLNAAACPTGINKISLLKIHPRTGIYRLYSITDALQGIIKIRSVQLLFECTLKLRKKLAPGKK